MAGAEETAEAEAEAEEARARSLRMHSTICVRALARHARGSRWRSKAVLVSLRHRERVSDSCLRMPGWRSPPASEQWAYEYGGRLMLT